MCLAQHAERALGIGFAGQRARNVLGEDRYGHRRDQFACAIGDPIDVARHGNPRLTRDACGDERRLHIDIVDVQQPGAFDRCARDLVGSERQPCIALPEHRPIARLFADQHHRPAVGDRPANQQRGVHAAIVQRLAEPLDLVIVAGRAEKRGAQAERSARGQGGRDLAAVADLLGRHRKLDVRPENAWQAKDLVNRALADSDNVPLWRWTRLHFMTEFPMMRQRLVVLGFAAFVGALVMQRETAVPQAQGPVTFSQHVAPILFSQLHHLPSSRRGGALSVDVLSRCAAAGEGDCRGDGVEDHAAVEGCAGRYRVCQCAPSD